MPAFYQSSYLINVENKNYIHAIATHNKNVLIEKINNMDVSDLNCLGSELPALLSKAKSKEFTIECISGDSDSTTDIFPSLDLLDAVLRQHKSDFSRDEAEGVRLAWSTISGYLQAKTENSRVFTAPPLLNSLDTLQALYVLNMLNHHNKISGAMHLADLNILVFQQNNENYILHYGTPTSIVNKTISLDIDDGFSNKYLDREKNSDLKNTLEALQGFFRAWQANNYTGKLIPDAAAGFTLCAAAAKTPAQPLYDMNSGSALARLSLINAMNEPKANPDREQLLRLALAQETGNDPEVLESNSPSFR